ncbi:MAG TPA: efflux RND transporter periplasmic adaptor subunit [Gemmataceae bacterium]|nr:efflux RND transporter periplasmic adaptor subunit [Gemmataceae bacterium]
MAMPRLTWRWMLAGASVMILAILGGWFGMTRGKTRITEVSASAQDAEEKPTVEVVSPKTGGIERICTQPGSIEPYEAADLYTKVSGFLIEQHVDIGSRVKEGQVLARISVPEYEKQVAQDTADVARAMAKVDQSRAAITTAEAERGAATAAIAFTVAEKRSKSSYRTFREKQRDRVRNLVDVRSIEAKVLDESEDQLQAAMAADLAAEEAVASAKQKEAAARARVTQAKADLRYAEAEVASAKARLERAKVLLDYTIIRSPYTGVITRRNFHRGDFVRTADAGGDRLPVLSVERTDIMRVVIQVPERDVPFVNAGDPAMVDVDALPGIRFKSDGAEKVEVSCLAASEDPHSRMMRTEVHVKNPHNTLRRGMFGRVTLLLEPAAKDALRIPSAALAGKAEGGKGFVRVVRDSKVYLVPIRYGTDNGSEVEVISGLRSADQIVLRSSGTIKDGTEVTLAQKSPLAGH